MPTLGYVLRLAPLRASPGPTSDPHRPPRLRLRRDPDAGPVRPHGRRGSPGPLHRGRDRPATPHASLPAPGPRLSRPAPRSRQDSRVLSDARAGPGSEVSASCPLAASGDRRQTRPRYQAEVDRIRRAVRDDGVRAGGLVVDPALGGLSSAILRPPRNPSPVAGCPRRRRPAVPPVMVRRIPPDQPQGPAFRSQRDQGMVYDDTTSRAGRPTRDRAATRRALAAGRCR